MTELALTLPAELVEAIAERAAAILAARQPLPVEASPWLSVEKAADYLDCTRQRIYDLKSSRRLPYGLDRSRPLFHRAVLDAYLSGAEAEAVRAVAARLPGHVPSSFESRNGR